MSVDQHEHNAERELYYKLSRASRDYQDDSDSSL